jgi:RHS repeat-associated protein
MGPLPAAGSWVKLEVPASLVGLEGFTLHGMAFSMWGGRATWDRAGKTSSAGVGSPIQWLVSDHLGTPRMIVDQTGTLANVKRHDYLPFGEELFAPISGRSTASGYGIGDMVRQQFTSKERDVETGLDYFDARYYSSTQGRFQSIDPYNINLERQQSVDPGEAEKEFSEYIFQPQHWNHYSYVLNNPLKFIDPDGRSEEPPNSFTLTLLGEEVKIVVSKKILKKDPNALAKVRAAMEKAFAQINNAHKDKPFTAAQLASIHRLNKIQVNTNKGTEGMVGDTFNLKFDHAINPNTDILSGNIMHDARHAEQRERGLNYGEKYGIPMEMEASNFVLGVIVTRGWSDESIQAFCKDSAEGHLPKGWKDKSNPKRHKEVFDRMKDPK